MDSEARPRHGCMIDSLASCFHVLPLTICLENVVSWPPRSFENILVSGKFTRKQMPDGQMPISYMRLPNLRHVWRGPPCFRQLRTLRLGF